MNKERQYALLEPDCKVSQALKYLDARAIINFYKLETYEDSILNENYNAKKISKVKLVHHLFTEEFEDILENYIIDYIRFDFDKAVIVVKPNKYYR